ncbi:MAG: antirestriction protein ArdA [Sulfurimonas sp.]|nr:antirestriction protein ArdA [Sulfurimonas sp.]
MTFEIVVRTLRNNQDARIELPNDNYVAELVKKFDGDDWIEYDYEIVDVEDEYNIFNSFKLYGFESLDKLNELATRIDELCSNDHSIKILQSASEVYMNIDEVLELMESDALELYENQEPDDIAEWYVDEGWYGDISDKLIMYIDYEKMGRDLMMGGNLHETKNGILEEM